jgi:hypothetical protein
MTNEQVRHDEIDAMMSAQALHSLQLAVAYALDSGGFEAVIAVCNDLVEGAARTDRPVGVWACAEWKGLDFVGKNFPGTPLCFSNYPYLFTGEDAETNVQAVEAAGGLNAFLVAKS